MINNLQKTCDWCKQAFEIRGQWELKHRRFCGLSCTARYRVSEQRKQRGTFASMRCPECGSVFFAKWGDAHRRHYCSISCAASGKRRDAWITHHVDFTRLSVADIAYIAGIVDGEGTIEAHPERPDQLCAISVSNTHKGLIDFLIAKFPSSHIHTVRKQKAHHKPCWRWNLGRAYDSLILLQLMRPYLIVKADVADEAIRLLQEHFARNRPQWMREGD